MAPLAGEMRHAAVVGAVFQDAMFAAAVAMQTGKFGKKVIKAIAKWAKGRPPEPTPKQDFPKRFHKRIETIWRALWACGKYQSGTIHLYTHVIGKLLEWADGRDITTLEAADLNLFLEFYVREGRPRAKQRLDKLHDEYGLGVRYVAFYAVRAVLDQLCGMNVTVGFPAPPHPAPVNSTSFAACRSLFDQTDSDRERMMLLLTNGVGLMPSESAALSWNDFEEEFAAVKVQRRDRPVTIEISERVAPLLEACRQRAPEHTFVFQSRRSAEPAPVCVRTLQHVLATLVERSEVSERVTLTALRKASVYIPGMAPPRESRHRTGHDATPAEPPGGPPLLESEDDAQPLIELDAPAHEPPECARLRRQLLPAHSQPEQTRDSNAGVEEVGDHACRDDAATADPLKAMEPSQTDADKNHSTRKRPGSSGEQPSAP